MPDLMRAPRRFIGLATLAALSLIGCGAEAPPEPVEVAQNDAIDPATREAIRAINSRIVNGFLAGDATPLRETFLPERLAEIEAGPGLEPIFQQIAGALTDTKLAPFHEFHIEVREPQPDGIVVPAEGEWDFSLTLPPTEGRVHVTLMRARAETRDYLVGLVYEEADDGWKLATVRVGGFAIGSRNAMDWFAEARALADEELFIPAAVRLMVAGGLLRPMPFLRYEDEEEVLALERRVSQALAERYSFPIELGSLPGKPRVVRLDPVFQRGSLLTLVSYVSGQELEQAAVDAEVSRVHPALAEQLAGLCHDSTRVAYKAFAEPPVDPQKAYDFVNAVAECS